VSTSGAASGTAAATTAAPAPDALEAVAEALQTATASAHAIPSSGCAAADRAREQDVVSEQRRAAARGGCARGNGQRGRAAGRGPAGRASGRGGCARRGGGRGPGHGSRGRGRGGTSNGAPTAGYDASDGARSELATPLPGCWPQRQHERAPLGTSPTGHNMAPLWDAACAHHATPHCACDGRWHGPYAAPEAHQSTMLAPSPLAHQQSYTKGKGKWIGPFDAPTFDAPVDRHQHRYWRGGTPPHRV
jgi:hypothetical protein